MPENWGFDTLAIHAGAEPDPATGARQVPIHQTTAYVFKDAGHAARLFGLQEVGYIYSRLTNPTVAALQTRIAAMEGGAGAVCCSSGHAAQILALFPLMAPGRNVIASTRLYGGTITQLSQTIKRFGWSCKFVDLDDPQAVRAAIDDDTRAIFCESISNPGGYPTDIPAIAAIADAAGVPLIVDNTLATPYLVRPLEHGADIVVHSATKFLGGHGNSIAGVIVDGGSFDFLADQRYPMLSAPRPEYNGMVLGETFGNFAFAIACRVLGLRDLGPSLSPFNAFMVLTGIETLALRMQRHSDNALAVATFLSSHPAVKWVSYPGLAGDRYHALAKRYCPKGAGAVFTFGLKGGYEAGKRFVEGLEMLSHLANIGDTRSLVIHPASTTHRQLSEEQQVAAGAGPDVVRLSIGIEDAADIIADIEQALAKA